MRDKNALMVVLSVFHFILAFCSLCQQRVVIY